MKSLKFLSMVFVLIAGFASITEARCIGRDPNDSYANMKCPSRSSGGSTYCEYDDDCLWTDDAAGTCGARDRNDSYAKMKCPSRSSGGSTYCEYDDDCRWYP